VGSAFPSSIRNHEMGVVHTIVLIFTVGDFFFVVSTVDCRLGYELGGPGFESLRGKRMCCSPKFPGRLWEPPRLLFNGHRGFFPEGKAART
jgi:hypothetical protein